MGKEIYYPINYASRYVQITHFIDNDPTPKFARTFEQSDIKELAESLNSWAQPVTWESY